MVPAPYVDPQWDNVRSLLQLNTDTADAKGLTWTASGASVSSGSLLIAADNDTLSTPFNTLFNWYAQPCAIEAWIYTTSHSQDAFARATLMGLGVYQPGTVWFWFGPNSTGLLNFGYWAGFSNNLTAESGAVPLNTWCHIAMQFDGSEIRLYVDGALVRTDPYEAAVAPTGSPTFRIGMRGSNLSRWQGRIRGFRLTHAVRYTGAFTPPALPLPETS